ncbi:MAG: hypothetical protein WKF66_03975 [Pedobacter sp.]
MSGNKLILILLTFISLLSCTKENNQDLVIDTSERHLVQITEVKGTATTITTLGYDELRRLSTIKTGNLITTYSYTGDKLTNIEVNDGYVNTVLEITYKDNYPSKGVSKIYTDGVLKRTLNYDYISSLSQTGQINIYETGNNTRRLYYEYNNANIISTIEIANRVFVNYDFEYGERKNVFFNASIRWPLGIETVDRVSTNEILKIKTESGGVKHQKTFNYTYDTDGMPLSAIVIDTDPPSKVEYKTMISYTYKNL